MKELRGIRDPPTLEMAWFKRRPVSAERVKGGEVFGHPLGSNVFEHAN